MNFQNKLLANICFLLLCLNGFGKDNTLPQFWRRVEVGTNIIPLIDSTSLNFDNLMLKYYYNTEQSRAFRINMFWNDMFYIKKESMQNYQSNYHFKIGHVNYYKFKPNLNMLLAFDFEYENYSYRVGSKPASILRNNNFFLNISGGVKYQFYKNWNIEFETAIIAGVNEQFKNYYSDINGTTIFQDMRHNYFRFLYKPINNFTLNYKF